MEQYYSGKNHLAANKRTHQYSGGSHLMNIYTMLRYALVGLLFVTLHSPLVAKGQKRPVMTRETQALSLLCHKWYVNKTAHQVSVLPNDAITSIRFLPSGYIIFPQSMQAEAVWSFDNSRKMLFILMNNNIWKYKVSVLSDTELILESINNTKKGTVYLWRNYAP